MKIFSVFQVEKAEFIFLGKENLTIYFCTSPPQLSKWYYVSDFSLLFLVFILTGLSSLLVLILDWWNWIELNNRHWVRVPPSIPIDWEREHLENASETGNWSRMCGVTVTSKYIKCGSSTWRLDEPSEGVEEEVIQSNKLVSPLKLLRFTTFPSENSVTLRSPRRLVVTLVVAEPTLNRLLLLLCNKSTAAYRWKGTADNWAYQGDLNTSISRPREIYWLSTFPNFLLHLLWRRDLRVKLLWIR